MQSIGPYCPIHCTIGSNCIFSTLLLSYGSVIIWVESQWQVLKSACRSSPRWLALKEVVPSHWVSQGCLLLSDQKMDVLFGLKLMHHCCRRRRDGPRTSLTSPTRPSQRLAACPAWRTRLPRRLSMLSYDCWHSSNCEMCFAGEKRAHAIIGACVFGDG